MRFFEASLLASAAQARGDAPITDGVNIPFTYNQLGNAYMVRKKLCNMQSRRASINSTIFRQGLGNSQKAVECYEAGLKLDPSTVALYVNLGLAYRGTGSDASARDAYQRFAPNPPRGL